MSTIIRDDSDRANNARFVRNLALSLSGGALLTVFAAGAAHADDLSDAGTVSDGTAGSKSGDATAVGNQSGTDASQGLGASGGGGVQVINQTGSTTNLGIAVANTGGNIAIGNQSNNTATGTQVATNTGGLLGLAGAVNNGQASNSSNGAAYVMTGDASAIGNKSTTSTKQDASTPAGSLGGLVLINQTGVTTNVGVGVANTGLNVAAGNTSTNTGTLNQIANGTGGGLATNSGSVANRSNGLATINTGNSYAIGNDSHTTLTQDAAGSGGDFPGGLTIINQFGAPVNFGVGIANSGANLALGNGSTNVVVPVQSATATFTPGLSLGIVSNSADVSNDSNGTAEISTGDTWASGNEATTSLSQKAVGESDLLSLALVNQNELVLNAGLGVANSGGNLAAGNVSPTNVSAPVQTANAAGMLSGVVSNQMEATNSSDGTATIHTGSATAHGNVSETEISQDALANGDGLNLINQVGAVGNLGAGVANSGINAAIGNGSSSTVVPVQTSTLTDPGADGGILNAVVSNSMSASNASDGTASITTGDATGTGNDSHTSIAQTDPTASTQLAVVANMGLGLGNSGGNAAVGNVSTSLSAPVQTNNITPTAALNALQVVQANQMDASNASDGTATISTGDASGTGNTSHTAITQDAESTVDGLGLVVSTQAAIVGNVGVGVGNSGVNVAVGNASPANNQLPVQVNTVTAAGDINVGQLVSNASLTASNASDGTATIRTGDASGRGNDSSTDIAQASTSTIDGLGLALNTQVAVVANAGLGIGNSGVNAAIGNGSNSTSLPVQVNTINGAGNLTAGQMVANGSLEAANASDGTALVDTGDASGSGNTSKTAIDQDLDTSVTGLGLVLGPQIGVVGNVGAGIANSGANLAVGNTSTNQVFLTQTTTFDPTGDITSPSIVVSGQGSATNASDGEACVCTGDATASGNISDTTLTQDIDLGVEDGLSIVPTVGVVLNAGFGLANSGLNLALGNVSTNTATGTQTSTLDPTVTGLVLPQVFSTSGSVSNSSDGTGEVGTGNATATGNLSTTGLTQAADIDGPGVFSTIVGGTTNIGAGLANAGLSLGVGNASTNTATFTQTAQGAGIVSNSADVSNESDGTGIVGDPNCDDETTTTNPPPADNPDGLPRTGGPIELQVMAAVMLMLAGFGMRRTAKKLS